MKYINKPYGGLALFHYSGALKKMEDQTGVCNYSAGYKVENKLDDLWHAEARNGLERTRFIISAAVQNWISGEVKNEIHL